jgi:anti-sigma factor RsiW
MAHLSDEDRENLVAYLDGELDEATAHALESKLSLDPVARAEADALRRTWELLDYLPRPEPSSDFTNRTLSRLSLPAPSSKVARLTARIPRRRRRWLVPLGWAAAVLLAAAGGFAAAQWLWPPTPGQIAEEQPPDVDDQLARNLRVVENLKGYEAVEDLETLLALAQPDLFGDDSD